MAAQAEIGVIGGSGFYAFLDDVEQHDITTPYGDPSAPVVIGDVSGRRVAFLPRHGIDHRFPPHRVNYRANLWALRSVGVQQVLGPCAVGSLRQDIAPGSLVVTDQLVDRTSGRPSTFYDGPRVVHVPFAQPYCPTGRARTVEAAPRHGFEVHDGGTLVVVQGPRFSSTAESRSYAAAGWSVIGMTAHPEAALARELALCFTTLALVTDYDVGVEGHGGAVTQDEVLRVFAANTARLRSLLFDVIPALPAERDCPCAHALDGTDGEAALAEMAAHERR
ncbi:MAG: 5-methylthioadenosine phosphorylase [Frankiaceae bacterium]|jgi:5'-methylthioadenosine phosphorylase|nr:5-methylthioadenosine phosphorylase [Frankiaceae bacterium]